MRGDCVGDEHNAMMMNSTVPDGFELCHGMCGASRWMGADGVYCPGGCKPADEVYHPAHYAQWKMEPIEFIAINDLPWWLANVIKYTMRFNMKDGLQDLRKGRSYLDMKIRQVEGKERFWDKPVSEERKANNK